MRANKGTVLSCYASWKQLSEEERGYWGMVARNLNKDLENEKKEGLNWVGYYYSKLLV